MEEERLEQLREIFRMIIKDVINNTRKRQEHIYPLQEEKYIQKIVNSLVFEVKKRMDK